jgi:hypothetical protein
VKATVFVGTSLDGFIARVNGAFDFLPAGGGEPHGYDEFMATVDALPRVSRRSGPLIRGPMVRSRFSCSALYRSAPRRSGL